MSVNKQILVGRTGSAPEVKHLDTGNKVAKFSIATTEVWKDKNGEKKEDTTWHNIIIWGKLAEVAEKYVKKGDLLYLEGRTKNSKYTDKDNIERYRTDVVVDVLQMLGGKKESSDSTPHTEAPESASMPTREPAASQNGEVDDLPF